MYRHLLIIGGLLRRLIQMIRRYAEYMKPILATLNVRVVAEASMGQARFVTCWRCRNIHVSAHRNARRLAERFTRQNAYFLARRFGCKASGGGEVPYDDASRCYGFGFRY